MKSPIPPETRQQVLIRDAHSCRYCGMGWRLEIHHRKGRGGSDPHQIAGLITLCSDCHRWATEHPAEAYRLGLSIRRLGDDEPDEVPYADRQGCLWALTSDGERFRLPIRVPLDSAREAG